MALPGPPPRARRRRPVTAAPVLTLPRSRSRPRSSAPLAPAAGHTGTTSPSATRPGFDWGNGRGGHSISRAAHDQHIADSAANNNPLYDPTTQLSGASLQRAATDLVNLEFNPQEAALKRELETATTQGTALAQRAGDYSGQIAANDAGIPGQQEAIKKLLDESLTNNAATATAAVDAQQTGVDQRNTADMTLRGGVGGDLGTAGAAKETLAAKDRIAADSAASKDAGALSTQSYQQLASLSAGAHAQMGQETQQGLLNRIATQQAENRAKQVELGTQRGAATSKAVTDLRQRGFENLITQQGLDIKTADLKAQALQDDATNKLAQARIDESAKTRRQRERIASADRKARADADSAAKQAAATNQGNRITPYGYTNAEWLKLPITRRQQIVRDYRKTGKGSTMTQSAVDKRTRIDSMLSDIHTDPKLVRHVHETGPRLVEILTKRGADPLEAQAAAEVARHGRLTPETEAALRRAGIKVPHQWSRTSASTGGGSGGNPASRTGAGDVTFTKSRRRKKK